MACDLGPRTDSSETPEHRVAAEATDFTANFHWPKTAFSSQICVLGPSPNTIPFRNRLLWTGMKLRWQFRRFDSGVPIRYAVILLISMFAGGRIVVHFFKPPGRAISPPQFAGI